MARRDRSARSLDEMTGALLRHTRLLCEYMYRAFDEGDADYLGEVACKLRLLAVKSRQNEALIQRVMSEHSLNITLRLDWPREAVQESTLDEYLDGLAQGIRLQ